MSLPGRARSDWWYLLPLFLNIIGGVIAYFAVRKDDPKLAKNCIRGGYYFYSSSINSSGFDNKDGKRP